MASRIFSFSSPLKFLASPATIGLTVGSACIIVHQARRPSNVLYCDSSSALSSLRSSSFPSRAQQSLSESGGGGGGSTLAGPRSNERSIYRQISRGSIYGLVAGVAVGLFSKPLTLLFGILLFGVQFAASRGIHVLPYDTIRRYVRGVDVRSLLTAHNAPFRLTFAVTFALAAFVPL